MTNKDKFLRDGVSVEEFCEILEENGVDTCGMRTFFETEVKPTLTEDERVILKNFKEIYKYIGREGTLYIAMQKKDSEVVIQVAIDEYKPDLFQFIKERRRIRDKGVIK